MRSRQVLDIIETMGPRGTGDITAKGSPVVKIFALTVALLMAASPVVAQQKQQQALGAGGQTNNSILTNNGLICLEEMVATFCNQPTGPNLAGYGSADRVPRPDRAQGLDTAPGPE
jgi:hypothetical protein